MRLTFEEAISLGANHPEMVRQLISPERRTSSLDWDKAKILGFTFNINTQEMDLKLLQKWATYNLRAYTTEYFPELIGPLGL